MSNKPYVRAKFIPHESLLPEKLQLGRLYFVADKKYIVCDNGSGPVIYSSFIPPPASDAGVTDIDYQDQIDELAESVLTMQNFICYLWQNSDGNISDLQNISIDHENRITYNENNITGLEDLAADHEGRISENTDNLNVLDDRETKSEHDIIVLKQNDELLQEQNDDLSESILEFTNHLLYIENLN